MSTIHTQEYTITAALKRIKLIIKRINDNSADIKKYSCVPDNMKLHFETADLQKAQINSLVQTNRDLMDEYLILHARVNLTNLHVKVKIGKYTRTIHDWLQYKRTTHKLFITSFKSMTDDIRTKNQTQVGIKLETYYDERFKMESIREEEDLFSEVDSRLETINATTNIENYV